MTSHYNPRLRNAGGAARRLDILAFFGRVAGAVIGWPTDTLAAAMTYAKFWQSRGHCERSRNALTTTQKGFIAKTLTLAAKSLTL